MQWQSDKRWADRFMPEIKMALGRALIMSSPLKEDQEHNTDLIVLKMEAVRIACRVRRPEYMTYKDDITIRAGRPSKIKTELTKIIEGWGDYLFYAICDADEQHLACWVLGDLRAFRLWHNRYICAHRGGMPGMRRENTDNSSWFYAYKWREIPGFVIDSSGHESTARQFTGKETA